MMRFILKQKINIAKLKVVGSFIHSMRLKSANILLYRFLGIKGMTHKDIVQDRIEDRAYRLNRRHVGCAYMTFAEGITQKIELIFIKHSFFPPKKLQFIHICTIFPNLDKYYSTLFV